MPGVEPGTQIAPGRGPYNARVADEAAVQVLETAHSAPNERVRGNFRVAQADSTLELVGWALGLGSPVVQLEVISNGEVVARTPPVIERPDIAEAFPGVAGAGTCGFQIAIEPSGRGESRLTVQVALKDGERAPLGELRVKTAHRRRRGLFRRDG